MKYKFQLQLYRINKYDEILSFSQYADNLWYDHVAYS